MGRTRPPIFRKSMNRLMIMATLPLAAVAFLSPGAAFAHGGDAKFRSQFETIQPSIPGIGVEVLNYDDRLLLINRTGKTVSIAGYEREPYARLRSNGAVEVNRRSPTHYLNEERYGGTPVPTSANPDAPPQWQTVGRNGRFEWHDHRIHWMSKDAVPPQVKDEDTRTKVFDWRVPIRVGTQRAALTGTLFWQPAGSSSVPAGAIVALVVLVLATLVLFALTRRRRRIAAKKPRQAW
jgi:hypothetical protein